MKVRRQKGFTLIEILVVVAIIAALAATMLPALFGAGPKARDSKRVSDLVRIKDVLVESSLVGKGYPEEPLCINEETFGDFLSDFGGAIPKDPIQDKEWDLYGVLELDFPELEGDLVCENEYLYVPGVHSSDISFGVFARVETAERVSIPCLDVALFVFLSEALEGEATEAWCYGLTAK